MKENIFLDEWKKNFYNQKLKITNLKLNKFSEQSTISSFLKKSLHSPALLKTTSEVGELQVKTNTSVNITEYNLQTYNRSNQDTCMLHRPSVFEGQWVQKGDLLADCSASIGGELALGQNIFVAYMPWEGYNYEDAILISERLVYDDVYTSIHIERYEIETRETKFGMEEITRQIPEIEKSEIQHLDKRGIIKVGTWVEEGTILVGKVTPTNKKYHSPYQKLLYTILEKEFLPTRDSSLRAPRGLKAKVINIQVINTGITNISSAMIFKNGRKSKSSLHNAEQSLNSRVSNGISLPISIQDKLQLKNKKRNKFNKKNYKKLSLLYKKWFIFPNAKRVFLKKQLKTINLATDFNNFQDLQQKNEFLKPNTESLKSALFTRLDKKLKLSIGSSLKKSKTTMSISKPILTCNSFKQTNSMFPLNLYKFKAYNLFLGQNKEKKSISKLLGSTNTNKSIQAVHIYLAEKRKIQMGDKMAGRHGNKGIVSQVLPRQDMPYLPDGTAIDMVLNPLGVPSRMNVGQIYECLLGLAGKYLGEYFRIAPFDEIYGAEASRSLVYSKLYEVRKKTGSKWIFNPNNPGKIYLYDGRTGESFDQAITVGQAYMLKLVHLVDDKIHARSTGPYSLVTQQPLRGRSKQGGQRLGEMEVWALEGYGAAFTLLEMLTIKSDDMTGRITLWSNIILNKEIYIGTPESFKVLVCELQALCLDIGLFRFDSKGFLKQVEHLMKLP
jgi:DNA-directed RNA polymerase subunit beta